MGREIKFRGKRLDNGEWAYGYYAAHKMMLTGEMDYFIIVNEQRPQSVDPKTVGQYTGLKDKNGREIYEGDVTKDEFDRVAIISWKENEARFSMRYISQRTDYRMFISHLKMVVIGNIYENPELLEV